jgi:exopolysaccharide biosynthesis polyprenyl glycosylphosphotransferase
VSAPAGAWRLDSALDGPAFDAVRARARAAGSRRGRLVRRALVVADVIGLAVAFLVAELVFGTGGLPADRVGDVTEYLLFLATLPGWVVVAKLYRLYDNDDERADHSTIEDFVGVFHLLTVGTWCVYVVAWASGAAEPGMSRLVAFWLLGVALVTLARGIARARCRRHPAYLQNTIVVGAGEVGQLVGRKLVMHREYGINLLGFVDAHPRERRPDLEGLSVLGAPDDLPQLVETLEVERVVVAFSGESNEDTAQLVAALQAQNVQVDIVPRLFDVVGPHVKVHAVEGLPLVALPTSKRFPFSRPLKRMMDVVGASLLLLVSAPIFALAAWQIRRDSPGPVFFRQTRLGKNRREFTILKFRTMRVDTDAAAHKEFIAQTMSAGAATPVSGLYKLERDDAVTNSGRWLRKTSLDELPQLLNVLRGEMSLVGPRPCLEYETEFFEPDHFERFDVPQGITGLWQVTARAHATFGEALDMDVAYARSWSLGLDLWLLLRTPLHMIRRKGTA